MNDEARMHCIQAARRASIANTAILSALLADGIGDASVPDFLLRDARDSLIMAERRVLDAMRANDATRC